MKNSVYSPSPVHRGAKAPAIYREVEEPTCKYNRLIEALPRKLTTEECIHRLTILPAYSPCERRESECYRIDAVDRLGKFRIPMSDDLITYQKFSRLFCEGYFNRNPSDAEWVKQLNAGFPGLLQETKADDYDWVPRFCNSGLGYGIFGASGVGKTSMVENILNFSPQVIVHTNYKGEPFDLQQLVWLKLDCPVKGSARSLCLDFMSAFDTLLGTSYYDRFQRLSSDAMLATMAQMSAAVSLGALVVDEIHRLCESHSGGEKAILNFFVKLANTVKIPVILIGTFKSLKLFSKDFSLARRIAGQGDHLISHKRNEREWEYFVKHLWRYQFTRIDTPLTEGVANALYDESQGLVDVAVKLYKMAQWSVIGTRCELITPEVISKTAEVNFNAARPMLQALRFNDFDTLAQIDDLLPQESDLQAFLKNSVSRIILTGTAVTLENLQQATEKPGVDTWQTNPILEIVSRLIDVGIEPDLAQKYAEIAFQRFKKSNDIVQATKEALRLAMLQPESDQCLEELTVPKRRKESIPSHPGDLRVIAGKGRKMQTEEIVENLKESGAIKSPGDFF